MSLRKNMTYTFEDLRLILFSDFPEKNPNLIGYSQCDFITNFRSSAVLTIHLFMTTSNPKTAKITFNFIVFHLNENKNSLSLSHLLKQTAAIPIAILRKVRDVFMRIL